MDRPNAGAAALAVLSTAIAVQVPEVPRALPATVLTTKRDDEPAPHTVHGPENAPPPMPEASGGDVTVKITGQTAKFSAGHMAPAVS